MSKSAAPLTAPAAVYRATHRRVRGSAKKARPVIDLIRGRPVPEARDLLRYTPKRAAYHIDRALQSAIANAESTGQVDVDDLVVRRAWIDEGPQFRGRWKFAAHGRVRPIIRRTIHIHVELAAAPPEAEPAGRRGAARGAKKAKE